MRFTVLFVCQANLCRSPMAEYLLRSRIGSLPWDVSSAGVAARAALPIVGRADEVLKTRGIDAADFRSRRVDSDLVDTADLILTASLGQRADVVTLRPDAADHTFALLQFARLCRELPAGSVADGPALLTAARDRRGLVAPVTAKLDTSRIRSAVADAASARPAH